MPRRVPPPVRDPTTGCLLWQGKLQPNGYPSGAHRKAYVAHYGSIPAGMTVDHVWKKGCRHKHCVEPLHLAAVPLIENIRRSYEARGLENACSKGHAYTPENTLTRKNGRACKTCQRGYRQAHYQKTGK